MKILVLNCGSSSLKFQLIDMENEQRLIKGNFERIGGMKTTLKLNVKGEKSEILHIARDYDEAIECFTNAGDYKDSKNQVQLARYNKAKVLISKKQYEDAARELKNAGDYAAAVKLLDTTITALITGKDYENAEKMAEYSDPATVTELKSYINGRQAYNKHK